LPSLSLNRDEEQQSEVEKGQLDDKCPSQLDISEKSKKVVLTGLENIYHGCLGRRRESISSKTNREEERERKEG